MATWVQQLRQLPTGLPQPLLPLASIFPLHGLVLFTAHIQSYRTLKIFKGKMEQRQLRHLKDESHPPFVALPSALAEPTPSVCLSHLPLVHLSVLPSVYLSYLPIYPPIVLFICLTTSAPSPIPPAPSAYLCLPLPDRPPFPLPPFHSLTSSFIQMPIPRIHPPSPYSPPHPTNIALPCPSAFPSSTVRIHTHLSRAYPPCCSCLGGLTLLTLQKSSPSPKPQAPLWAPSSAVFPFLFSAHSCV